MVNVHNEGLLRGLFSISPKCKMSQNGSGDVFVTRPDDTCFRLGYWASEVMFTRENPVMRALRNYGVKVLEGPVGLNREPQYDMTFYFDRHGNVETILDNRISSESENRPRRDD